MTTYLEFDKRPLKKGAWSSEEDKKLISYINRHGICISWNDIPKAAGLQRTGKSSRLRWMNYLRPDIRNGDFTQEENETIITLKKTLGTRWSAIAAKLPGRTDNAVKNHWHAYLKKLVNEKSNYFCVDQEPGTQHQIIMNTSEDGALNYPGSYSFQNNNNNSFLISDSLSGELEMEDLRLLPQEHNDQELTVDDYDLNFMMIENENIKLPQCLTGELQTFPMEFLSNFEASIQGSDYSTSSSSSSFSSLDSWFN